MTEVAPIRPRKKRRVFLWFFLAVQVLFVVWMTAGTRSGSNVVVDCTSISAQECSNLRAARDVGTGIGVGLIFLFWFFVDSFLAIGYGVYRLATRP